MENATILMSPSTGISGILLSVRTQYTVTVRDLTGVQFSDPLEAVEHHSYVLNILWRFNRHYCYHSYMWLSRSKPLVNIQVCCHHTGYCTSFAKPNVHPVTDLSDNLCNYVGLVQHVTD